MDALTLSKTSNIVSSMMDGFYGGMKTPNRWFICFGTLLKFIRDKGDFMEDEDFDVGMLYEDVDLKRLYNSIKASGLEMERQILNDVDRKPLYMHLKSSTHQGVRFCLFFWFKHADLRFHTYDVKMEKLEIPSRYIFKGCPGFPLDSGPILKVNVPGTYMQIQIPQMYGTLFDHWYPHWIERRKENSQTRWKIGMKSCAEFSGDKFEKITERHGNHKWCYGEKVEA